MVTENRTWFLYNEFKSEATPKVKKDQEKIAKISLRFLFSDMLKNICQIFLTLSCKTYVKIDL